MDVRNGADSDGRLWHSFGQGGLSALATSGMADTEHTAGESHLDKVPWARRSSPRLSISRPVIIKCAHWEDFEETLTINISRDALLLVVENEPPRQGDLVDVWAPIMETDRRRWVSGRVVRRATEVDGAGVHGVVVRLTNTEVGAIECLILESERPVPFPDEVDIEDDFSCFDDPSVADAEIPGDKADEERERPSIHDQWTQPMPAPPVEPKPDALADDKPPSSAPLRPLGAVPLKRISIDGTEPDEEPGGEGVVVAQGIIPVEERNSGAAAKVSKEALADGSDDEGVVVAAGVVPAEERTPTPSSADEGSPRPRTAANVYRPPPPPVIQAELDFNEFSEEEEAELAREEAELARQEELARKAEKRPAKRLRGASADRRDRPSRGSYSIRPAAAVDEVGAGTIGYAAGLARSDTRVDEVPPVSVTPEPTPAPSGKSLTDTWVTGGPEVSHEPEEEDEDSCPEGLTASDTVVTLTPSEPPPPSELISLAEERSNETQAPSIEQQAELLVEPWDDEDNARQASGEPSAEVEVDVDVPPASPEPGARREEGRVRQIGTRSSVGRGRAPAFVGRAEAPAVGIDFGTTYCKVAVCEGDEVTLIEDLSSSLASRASTPSMVAWPSAGKFLVGEYARDMLATDPSHVIYSIKRVMGLGYSDPLANGLLGSLACNSFPGPNDSILFDVHGQAVTVPEVVSLLLQHLRQMASQYLGAEVRKAVFTFPVEFDRRAKRELELAARMAGLEVIGLVPEPVAAAMGCGHDGSGQAHVAIYDFGGGTFDVSIVEVGHQRFQVCGSAGDRWLGGDDFDEVMARYVADEFLKRTSISLHNRAEEWQRLIFACEEAKRWLTSLRTVDVVLPRAAMTKQGPATLLVSMHRNTFHELASDIISSTLEVCQQATMQAGISPQQIDTLLITGGTSRIPAVRQAAEYFFGKPSLAGIHPQHAVVIGGAVRAAVSSGANVPEDFADRLRGQGAGGRTIRLALAGGATECIIDRSHRPPTVAHRLYSTQRDGQTAIRLELVEGSSERTAENRRIGGFIIEGLPARRAGAINLDVYFELSSTGTLYVTAQERSTGHRAQGTFELGD